MSIQICFSPSSNSSTTALVETRRAVERDYIAYPYNKSSRHDAASPIKYNYKIDHSRA